MFSRTKIMTRRPLQLAFILQVCCLLCREGYSQKCVHGLMSAERVRQLGRVAGNLVQRKKQQRIIPDIAFTCSGTVTKWIMAADWDRDEENYPEMQVWRATTVDGVYTKIHGTTLNINNESDSRIYEYSIYPADVQPGDVLGMFEPDESWLELYYTNKYGPINYYIDTDDDNEEDPPGGNFSITNHEVDSENDMPLVTVEITPTDGSLAVDCIRSFATMEMIEIGLQKRNKLIEEDSDQQLQRLIPEVNFTCHGFVTKWILAAEWQSKDDRVNLPELQTWNSTDGITYTKQGATTFNVSGGSDEITYYEYSPNPPHEFNDGDVLGIFIPEKTHFGIFFERIYSGPLNYIDRSDISSSPPSGTFIVTHHDGNSNNAVPLLAVEVSLTMSSSSLSSSHLQLSMQPTTYDVKQVLSAVTATSVSKTAYFSHDRSHETMQHLSSSIIESSMQHLSSNIADSSMPSNGSVGAGEVSVERYAGISIGIIFGVVLGVSVVAVIGVMVMKRRKSGRTLSDDDRELEEVDKVYNVPFTSSKGVFLEKNMAYGAFDKPEDASTAPATENEYYMNDLDMPPVSVCHQPNEHTEDHQYEYDYVTGRVVGARHFKVKQARMAVENDLIDSVEYI